MRFLLAAVVAPLAITACAFGGGGEPLSSTAHFAPVSPAAQHQPSAGLSLSHSALVNLRNAAAPRADAPTATDPAAAARAAAIADMATTVAYASTQATAAAQAGQAHDLAAAQQAAAELADAAGQVQARALDLASAGGCGGDSGVTQDDVDAAVANSAAAASAASEISDTLDPAPTQSCTQECGCEGCNNVCTDQPGTVDETVLSQQISDENTAAAGCQDASANLGGTGVLG